MNIIIYIGKGLLNLIYLFHKLAPTRDRITIFSRQSDTPSVDIVMLSERFAA